MSRNFRETIEEEMKNPEFKEEYEKLEEEFQNIKINIYKERKQKNINKKRLKTK